jgi:hypothetical protein
MFLLGLDHGILQFTFSANGIGGIAQFTEDATGTVTSTAFSTYTNLTNINPYSLTFAVDAIPTGIFGVSVPYQVKCGCDRSTSIQVDGRFQSFYWFNGWQQHTLGEMAISR